MISLVVAMGDNHVIGKDGWMPWDLPEDLKVFRSLTLHHKIVMGRTTFEALAKPLPNRFTYVISKNSEVRYPYQEVEVVNDFDTLLQQYQNSEEVLYICGGAKIYEYAMDYVDEMWISLVDQHYEGDTFFPMFKDGDFTVQSKEKKQGFTLIHYVRCKE